MSRTRRTGLKDGRFAGHAVAPGDIVQVDLKVSETVTHQPARIPVTVVRGERDGPTLFVTGAVHGDEINGVAVVRRVLDRLEPDQIDGTLIGVPVVNRFGFSSQDRYLPDRRDLNRFFPGDRGGSMASRIAEQLFRKVVAISDAGIDLHTASQGQSNLCHIRGDADNEEVRDLMRAFGTPVLLHNLGPKGSLRRAADSAGVPTVLFEAGEPNRFQHHVVEIGYEGVLRVMHHLGMLYEELPRPALQILVRRTEWIRADHGGLLDLDVEPGDLVRKGQHIGVIHDPFGRHVDAITTPYAGVVLSTATVPLCYPGNAVVHLGYLDKTLQKARRHVKAGGDLGHVNWVSAMRERQKTGTGAPPRPRAGTGGSASKDPKPSGAHAKKASKSGRKGASGTAKGKAKAGTKKKRAATKDKAAPAKKAKKKAKTTARKGKAGTPAGKRKATPGASAKRTGARKSAAGRSP